MWAAVTFAGEQPAWQPRPALPLGFAGHAGAISQDGTLWVAGGSYWNAETKRIDDAVRQLPAGETTWKTAVKLNQGFAHGGFASTRETLWLVGGLTKEGPSRAIQRVTFAPPTVVVEAQLPEPRVYCGAAVLEGSLWIVGGSITDGSFAELPTAFFRYDLARKTVETLPFAGPAIVNPVVLAIGRELHVLPGSRWSPANQRLESPTEIWVFTPARGEWKQRPLRQPLPRGLSGVALDDRYALLTGGVELRNGDAHVARDSWIYDARRHSVKPSVPLHQPRLGAALTTDNKTIWLTGGEDRPRSRSAEVWSLVIPKTADR